MVSYDRFQRNRTKVQLSRPRPFRILSDGMPAQQVYPSAGRVRVTVFVLDEDPQIRASLKRLEWSEGYTVRSFESPESFLRDARRVPGACLLVDVARPGLGAAFRSQMTVRNLRMPVVALSARDETEGRHAAGEVGARCFFRKPVDDRTLIDAIDWVVTLDPGDAPA